MQRYANFLNWQNFSTFFFKETHFFVRYIIYIYPFGCCAAAMLLYGGAPSVHLFGGFAFAASLCQFLHTSGSEGNRVLKRPPLRCNASRRSASHVAFRILTRCVAKSNASFPQELYDEKCAKTAEKRRFCKMRLAKPRCQAVPPEDRNGSFHTVMQHVTEQGAFRGLIFIGGAETGREPFRAILGLCCKNEV